MNRAFTALGRFVVRFRFLVVVAWIVVTFLAVRYLPALADVAKDTTSGFLPNSAPSMVAAGLAAPFQDVNLATATVVAARDGGLTAADNAAIDQVEAKIKGIDKVKVVADLGISGDGAARQALVQADVVAFSGGPEAKALVDSIRSTLASSGAAPGLQLHLTGQLAAQIDQVEANGSSQNSTQSLSLLFIVVLLLLAFRAVLAPIVTLLPAAFVLVLSGPVIAESTKIGVPVSAITELLLIVLILGAGTDYGVFLVFRVREEMRRGLTSHEAVIRSVSRVGESITFSALCVIVALLSLVLAEFGFYQSLGPALAIGIALMLLAGLTLMPALLAIFGRAVFWPTGASPSERQRHGLWERVGIVATRRPGATLAAGLVLFGALSAVLLTTGTAGFGDSTASPAGTDSAAGSCHHRDPLPVIDGEPFGAPVRLPDLGLGRSLGPRHDRGRPQGAARVQRPGRPARRQRHGPDAGAAGRPPRQARPGSPAPAGPDRDRHPGRPVQRLSLDRPAHQHRRSHGPVLGDLRQRRCLDARRRWRRCPRCASTSTGSRRRSGRPRTASSAWSRWPMT